MIEVKKGRVIRKAQAMYTQKTVIRAPIGKMDELRNLIAEKYLPVVRNRTGFVGACLLEQTDDTDCCELLIFWDNQAAIEAFHRTGFLEASLHKIAVDLPGARIQRQGYIIRVTAGKLSDITPEKVRA